MYVSCTVLLLCLIYASSVWILNENDVNFFNQSTILISQLFAISLLITLPDGDTSELKFERQDSVLNKQMYFQLNLLPDASQVPVYFLLCLSCRYSDQVLMNSCG